MEDNLYTDIEEQVQLQVPAQIQVQEKEEAIFQQALDDQINLINKKKNTIQMRIDFIKQLYSLFLTIEGRRFMTDHEEVRNMIEIKTTEFINDLLAENDPSFLDMSREVLIVVMNINKGHEYK
jgi:hypothetical protein